jgi:5,10-methylenetetrahydrofolate reductase
MNHRNARSRYATSAVPNAAGAAPSRLAEAIRAGRFVLTTSLGTLRGTGREELRRRLRAVKEAFAFVKFGDNPRARARPSPWAAAAVALAEGLEPVAHMTCRDRNRLALKSDLLGGRLLGVRNVLCLRGDELELSDEPEARAVHDVDVVDLIRLASRVGEGELYVLAACDPNAGASDSHFARLRQKLAAGASLLESQPVFDAPRFADWLARLRGAGIDAPLLVDVSVVTTQDEARLLERIPLIRPPEDLEARLRRNRLAGIELAAEVAAAVRELPGVAGCHLSPIRGDPKAALAVAERLA